MVNIVSLINLQGVVKHGNSRLHDVTEKVCYSQVLRGHSYFIILSNKSPPLVRDLNIKNMIILGITRHSRHRICPNMLSSSLCQRHARYFFNN